jgi:hypothetical protein
VISNICEHINAKNYFALGFFNWLPASDYWTSGTDKNCDTSYRWCALGKNFLPKEIRWGSGEPNQANGDCVYVKFSNVSWESTALHTANCIEEKHFICEVVFIDFKNYQLH